MLQLDFTILVHLMGSCFQQQNILRLNQYKATVCQLSCQMLLGGLPGMIGGTGGSGPWDTDRSGNGIILDLPNWRSNLATLSSSDCTCLRVTT